MVLGDVVQTFLTALLFAGIFRFGSRLHSPINVIRRNALSLGAGASVAYIFILLLPELENAGAVFRRSTSHLALPYQGQYSLHLATMIGFLIFYGLEQMMASERNIEGESASSTGVVFWTHMGGFGSYAWITSYLVVRSLESGEGSLFVYAFAIGLHFFLVSHSLNEEHGIGYDRIGSWLLAGCSLGGWLCGVLLDLPKPVVVILFGLVAGGVLVNTMLMELPRDQKGKFFPFLSGAVAYAALIILFY